MWLHDATEQALAFIFSMRRMRFSCILRELFSYFGHKFLFVVKVPARIYKGEQLLPKWHSLFAFDLGPVKNTWRGPCASGKTARHGQSESAFNQEQLGKSKQLSYKLLMSINSQENSFKDPTFNMAMANNIQWKCYSSQGADEGPTRSKRKTSFSISAVHQLFIFR